MSPSKDSAKKLKKWAAKATQRLTKPQPTPGLRCADCSRPVRSSRRPGAPRCATCRATRSTGSVIEMSYHPTHPDQGVTLATQEAPPPSTWMSAEEAIRRMQRVHAQPDPVIDQREGIEGRLPQGTRLDGPVFREGSQHRAANSRPLRDLRTSLGVHRPAPSGPPGHRERGRPLGDGPMSRAKPQPSLAARAYHWRKLARPIKVSTEDWELLRLATVGDPEPLKAPQIAARLGGSATAAAVRKRLERVRAAVKTAN